MGMADGEGVPSIPPPLRVLAPPASAVGWRRRARLGVPFPLQTAAWEEESMASPSTHHIVAHGHSLQHCDPSSLYIIRVYTFMSGFSTAHILFANFKRRAELCPEPGLKKLSVIVT